MTQAEKLSLVFGWLGIPPGANPLGALMGNKTFHDVIGSSGYVPGIARLGIPALQETDASLGVANLLGGLRPGDVATALPSSLSLAASFDSEIAHQGGAMIASEAWHKGLNVLLGPGVNLARDPRNGRNFEYLGEDPLLAGTLAAQSVRGIQDQHVIASVKHYALNDQETNRSWVNALIDEGSLRESDLLAFELAIEDGKPGSVMCSYNLVNGTYACGNGHLLNDVLKTDWHFPGWVMSDWGAVHSLDSATAGLDQESAGLMDKQAFFGAMLDRAVADGTIPEARLTDMAQRILRSMFAVGVIDHPATKGPIDYKTDSDVALQEAEEGIVLLKNDGQLLPVKNALHVAFIGGHADAGVLSGGGSSQVNPVGKPSAVVPVGGGGDNPVLAALTSMVFDPSAPLSAIRAAAPNAEVRFDPGNYLSAAARLAKWADVVVVFATQWQTEGVDVPDLTLPHGQDELIDTVAEANPKTVVVLETGNPVRMPWLDKVGAVIEAWYPGQRGGEAIADVLFGKVNPSGHLPITFPEDISQYPRADTPGSDIVEPQQGLAPGHSNGTVFDVNYSEGAFVGYRWFAQKDLTPLFPFGFGLSYTDFGYSNLSVKSGSALTIAFDVTNTGSMAGNAVPQVYLTSRAGEPLKRLIGFSRVPLAPGETQHVSLTVDPRLLADFNVTAHGWQVPAGNYEIMVGRSATDEALTGSVTLASETSPP
jgi:beta-glucosidase